MLLGIGVKRSRDEDWIERQDAFNKMLANLNAVQSNLEGGTSSPTPDRVASPQAGKTLVDSAVEAKQIV